MDIKCLEKKIMILGEDDVGKTSVCRHAFNTYDERYVNTLGTRVSKKVVNINHPKYRYIVNMMIWERKEETVMKKADGAFMVYDVTNRESMERMEEYWIPAFRKADSNASIVFVANKRDLNPLSMDSSFELLEEKYHSPCVLTSAKTGENINFVFQEMGRMLAKPHYNNEKRLFVPNKLTSNEAYNLIAASFINGVGSKDPALPVLMAECRKHGIDPEETSKNGLKILVEKLSDIEKGFLDSYTVKKNMIERRKIVEKI